MMVQATGLTRKAAPKIALTIAGFDPSSGAGITADLQVFAAFGLFGTACITSLTVQSTRGVRAVQSVSGLISETLAELEADLPPAGIKIGMLGDRAAVEAVAAYLRVYRRKQGSGPVVLDPVLVSSTGAALLAPDGVASLREELLPLVDWVTPNHAELRVLTAESGSREDELAALHGRWPHLHIVATGGDLETAEDVLMMASGEILPFRGEHVATTSTHGTGCAFSSALLARLLLGDGPEAAVVAAKAYVAEALRHAPGLGTGHGPMGLLWPLRG